MSETDVVTVATARSPFQARVLAGILDGAGIPCYVAGQMLTDEFAMSQTLMNLQRVDVQVPGSRVDDALEALAAARAAGAQLDDASFDPGPPEDV